MGIGIGSAVCILGAIAVSTRFKSDTVEPTLSESVLLRIEEENRIANGITNPKVTPTATPIMTPTTTSEATQKPKKTTKLVEKDTVKENKKYCIVIDPGHQAKQNSEQEAVAPNSKETKKKVTSGTQGRYTNVPEYEVNLSVGLLLRDSLEKSGYTVIMTRESNQVDISNIERAKIANKANADVFIRLHCNGSENEKVNGILTICPTKQNKYCKEIYNDCYKLSDFVLQEVVAATGAKDKGITQTDTMSGINWSKVPVTIIEMGYMTNEKEDRLLVTKKYQEKLVAGITEGIRRYLSDK